MKYANKEMKIDQIIGYFNEGKINLIPPFQRGSVWSRRLRQSLLVNMVMGRPIPALFLYKEPDGSKFSYNILDGKQRLESLMLFIGTKSKDMAVDRLDTYFFQNKAYKDADFKIDIGGKKTGFANLDPSIIRAFKEYPIATVEIDLDDDSASIDEIINLFVDINQKGKQVARFDILKALVKDKLVKQVLGFIAIEQKRGRGQSKFYKMKNGAPFVAVLKQLNAVRSATDNNSKVDRMWERLTEIGLFVSTGTHRRPAEVLKAFIRKSPASTNKQLTGAQIASIRRAFTFLTNAYKAFPNLKSGRLATDQPQFYTLITTLLSSDLLSRYGETALAKKLSTVSGVVSGTAASGHIKKAAVDRYNDLSTKATADPGRRSDRATALVAMIDAV